MPKLTRRRFFTQSSIGATAFSLLAFGPFSRLAVDSSAAEVDTSELSPSLLSGPLIAHVRDLATGEVSVMSGVREVIIRDPQLVAKLLRATR